MASVDLEEVETQIAIAKLQIEIANQELVIHDKTVQQNQQIEAFYRSKFSNQELYYWLIGRLSGPYFQAFNLAYATAKAAEKALQYELPTTETYISLSHWDSRYKGLLAGKALMLDLDRMAKSHLDQDSCFLEIEKTISMQKTFPGSLRLLLANGVCEFELSERLFDQDFPGHYFRVIKTIAISIKANVKPGAARDPYESIKPTLAQTGNKALLSPDIGAAAFLLTGEGEPPDQDTLRVNWRASQQIAISKPVADDGTTAVDLRMFNLDFIFDDRYFPFEGTGAVSYWRLEIPQAPNASFFEAYDITDVIIHLRYTAKSDRGAFKAAVEDLLKLPPS